MKKCAIISLYGNNNYGNKLQNYAVYKLLQKNDINANVIRYTHYQKDNRYKKNYKKLFDIKYIYNKFHSIIINKLYCRKNTLRRENFNEFNKFIQYSSNIVSSLNDVKKLNNEYDYFLYGSDQIWNIGAFRFYDLAFGTYFDKNKNFSFSASFGRDHIPNDYFEAYKKGIENIKLISVREDAGKKIVKKISNRDDTEVLVDPTMLLSDEEWKKVSKKPKNMIKEKYILNYFLGEMNTQRKKEIYLLAEKNNWKVINLLDPKDPFYTAGPSEFLYLEEHAELICTDSFHSCVFSILLNTPFIVFDRDDENTSMNSRIETLLSKFKLEDRKFNGKITEKNLKCNYTNTYKILEQERKKANIFLKKALEL